MGGVTGTGGLDPRFWKECRHPFLIDSIIVKSFCRFVAVLLLGLFILLTLSGVKPAEILHDPLGVLKTAYLQATQDSKDTPQSIPEASAASARSAPALPEESKPAPAGDESTVKTAEPALDLPALCKNANAWPKSVTLKIATQFPVVMNGNPLGNAEVPAGTAVILVAIQDGRLVLDYQGGKQTVAVEATDLIERLQASKQDPTPGIIPTVAKPAKIKQPAIALKPTSTPIPDEPAEPVVSEITKHGNKKTTFFGTLDTSH